MCQHTDPGMTLKHRDLIHSGQVATHMVEIDERVVDSERDNDAAAA